VLLFRCDPTVVGDHWKTVSIHTNAENHGGSYKFRCTGAGVDALASTTEMPGPLNMPMGPPPMPLHQGVGLQNNGQMPLNANYMWQNAGPMWGYMPPPLTESGAAPEAPQVTLNPGESLTLDLTCTPPTPGIFVNTFRITTNDPVNPVIDYNVACHGFLPSPPENIQGGNYWASAGPTPIYGVAASPDGAFVLAGHYNNNVLRVYSRDAATGNLSPYTPYDSVSAPGMSQIYGIAYSHDGQDVYYTSNAGDGVVWLNRSGGILSYGDHWTRTSTYLCGINPFQFCPYNTMDGAQGVAVSPDDGNVYVTGYFGGGSLTVFNRNLTTGGLSLAQRITETVTGPDVLSGATRVVVSPDGEHVYVASYLSDTISAFQRDSNGRLALQAVYQNGEGGLTSLDAPADLVLSPDGEFLYVAAYGGGGALNVFRRSSGDGGLALVETVPGNNPSGLAMSVDEFGERLFVSRYLSDTVQAYGRDPDTGTLSFINGVVDTLFTNLQEPVYLAVSPDGQDVYASLDADTGLRQILTVRHAPVMGNISPAAAVQGSSALSLTVNGARFYPNSIVRFGAFPLSTEYISENELRANVPPGFLVPPFDNVSVVVETSTPGGGQSEAALFTVVAPGTELAPSIESLEPPEVAFNGEDVVLIVHGANFLPAVQVTFNDVPVPTVYLNGETLQITLDAALLTEPGTGGLAVTNLAPGAATLAEDAGAAADTSSTVFGLRLRPSGAPALPGVTRLDPASVLSGTTGIGSGAPGLWVTVTGHNFLDGTQGQTVGRFNGQERSTVVISANELKLRLEPDDMRLAGTYPLTAFTDGVGESAEAEFRVLAPGEKPVPALRAAAASPEGVLYLFGSDFDAGAQALLNGAAKTPLAVTSTTITLLLEPHEWSGVATLTNPGPGGGTSSPLVYVNFRRLLPVIGR
jgi:DNA-binding beta-propeller fold protein YncE